MTERVDEVLTLDAGELAPLTSPVLIVGLTGWFDVAGAATAALAHLAEHGVTVGEIDADPFYDFTQERPIVEMVDGESRSISLAGQRVHGRAHRRRPRPRRAQRRRAAPGVAAVHRLRPPGRRAARLRGRRDGRCHRRRRPALPHATGRRQHGRPGAGPPAGPVGADVPGHHRADRRPARRHGARRRADDLAARRGPALPRPHGAPARGRRRSSSTSPTCSGCR